MASYLGCYHDSSERDLPNQLQSTHSTIESCTALASEQGYIFFGLQYGGECWAGDNYGSFGKLHD